MSLTRPNKLSRELVGAIAEEQQRQAIDAAKKKAVAQHADYDTFKKMVSVAHLKPLHAASSHGAPGCALPALKLDPNHLFSHDDSRAASHNNSSASSSSSGQDAAQSTRPEPASAHSISTPPKQLPRTSQEFARDWRRACHTPACKYRLLKQCGAAGLSQIFKVEIDSIMLGQVVQVVQQQWQQQAMQQQQRQCDATVEQPSCTTAGGPALEQQQQDNASAAAALVSEAVEVVMLLQSLAGTGRFDLNVRLLDKSSKAAAADLCRQLQEVLQQQHQVQVQAQAQQQQLEGDLTEWREEDLTEQLQREQAGADSGCAGLSSTSSAHIAQDSLQELMHKLRV